MTEKEKRKIERLFEEIVKKEQPEAKYWYYPTSGCDIIDMPRDHQTHGSSIALRCNQNCEIEGDLISHPKALELMEKEVEKFGCKVVDVHEHSLLFSESHMHIECKSVPFEKVRKMLEYVRWL